jgi:hypothetical protein
VASSGGAAGTGSTTGGNSSSGGSSSTEGGASGGLGGEPTVGGNGDGGSAGEAGSGTAGDRGAAGAPGVDLQPVGTIPADKIDLLFVVDNSISMADKQEILKSALPVLVRRLATPVCVDAAGNSTGQHASASGVCASGQPEFPPIRDIHIGVVTSSLGAHGGDICVDVDDDDKGRLLPSMRTGLSSWNSSGFLAWDPEGTRNQPAGENDANRLVTDFENMVVAAGEKGCGYESTLEAWYRFLVQPDPPTSVTRRSDNSGVDVAGPDSVVLEQRARFLRPDSLVGVVLFTDENDCSIMDAGQGFLVGTQKLSATPFQLPRATSACALDANDPCCQSCAATAAAPGCTTPSADTACQSKYYTAAEDNLNLRCWDQKRRFGFDLLYPISRYLDGLTQAEVPDRQGAKAPNPLFQAPSGMTRRDPSRIFLLGMVGVPWQDLADSQSLSDPRRLKYLSFNELEAAHRFPLMLGENGGRPSDGLMFETTQDRSSLGFGPHPLTGDAIAPPSSTSPKQNPINGHESSNIENLDLQFACIFRLQTPRDCSSDSSDCDCHATDTVYTRALCQPPAGGSVGTTQYFAKAYPGIRHLELIRAFGERTNNAVAASICPKVLDSGMPSTDASYGYNPAVSALVDRMKSALAPACLATPLETDANGAVSCDVLEVRATSGACSCTGAGRGEPSVASAAGLRARLKESLYCGAAGQPSCESLCVCGLEELAPSALPACQNDAVVPAGLAGYCYIDTDKGLGSAKLVESCPVDRKRRLRFVGTDLPRAGSSTYVLCPP